MVFSLNAGSHQHRQYTPHHDRAIPVTCLNLFRNLSRVPGLLTPLRSVTVSDARLFIAHRSLEIVTDSAAGTQGVQGMGMQGHVWGAILYTTSYHVASLRCALLEDANRRTATPSHALRNAKDCLQD